MASESEKKKKKSKPAAQDEVPEYLIKPEDVQPTLDTSKWPLLLKVRPQQAAHPITRFSEQAFQVSICLAATTHVSD